MAPFAANGMRAVWVDLPEELIEETQQCASVLGLTRSAYIRRAIEEFNRETARGFRVNELGAASRKARVKSMRVNEEFAAFEQDPDG